MSCGPRSPSRARRRYRRACRGLRKALGAGAGTTRDEPAGLRAPLRAGSARPPRLRASPRAGRARGPTTAAERLRDALALWRGAPLADFAYEPFAQAAIGRLAEVRLLALERRIDADLALGRDGALVRGARDARRRAPASRAPAAQLMLALYRSGRQAEALAAYQTARRVLVDELGIEPSAALQELERAILRQDPALETRAGDDAGALDPRIAWLGDGPPESLLAIAEPLARKEPRELIVARLLADRPAASAAAAERPESSTPRRSRHVGSSRGRPSSRATSPGADCRGSRPSRTSTSCLSPQRRRLLDDSDLGEPPALCTRATSPSSSAASRPPARCSSRSPGLTTTGARSSLAPGSRGAGRYRFASPGPRSRVAATRAACSRARPSPFSARCGVAAEPVLVEPGSRALVAAAEEAGGRRSSACRTAGARTASARPGARWPQAATRRCSCARACGRAASRRQRT